MKTNNKLNKANSYRLSQEILRNKALAVLGLGTAGAVGAGAVGSVISSQRKNRKRK